MEKQNAYQIHQEDNVATALTELHPGTVILYGADGEKRMEAMEKIPRGHKIALRRIQPGERIVKYGVPIGMCTELIQKGSWVHLHVMQSLYDTRSSHLDEVTGAPKDMEYE